MPTDTLLSPDELADYLKVPVKTIYNWRTKREGPRAVKVGRHVRYRQSEIDAWLDRQADER